MIEPRLVSLLGLGFGDCGKGVFTDALCRRWPVHTVIRFNGGAQAGHNVVLPDGRHHTFAQFSAGTFVPGVKTLLAHPVVVHPTALLIENAHLRAVGVGDALKRLHIDQRCRVNTPFHQAAGRLRELQRGARAHGSCGVGVGETVRHALQHPDHVLRYGDLARPALAMQKLEAIRCDLFEEFAKMADDDAQRVERRVLEDPEIAERWLSALPDLLGEVPPASPAEIAEQLHQAGTVLFEGAQGVLLDEWKGFHPHTTWSSINTDAVHAVAADYGLTRRIEHLGILRSYLTRHGHGPMPTFDATLSRLPEPHNTNDGWQGQFRRGHPDAVLLRYALSAAGPLDGLLISHLDVFDHIEALRWCNAYRTDLAAYPELVTELPSGAPQDLAHQSRLTNLLTSAHPEYSECRISSPQDFLVRVKEVASLSPWFCSYGPTFSTVRES